MSNRRSFFKSLSKAAAIIALAPQIAFGVKPEMFGTTDGTFAAQKAFVQNFFYGKAIPGAALEGWKKLEPIQAYAHPFYVWSSKKAHKEEEGLSSI